MANLNSKEIQAWLSEAILDPPNTQPIYIVGQPGIGKSAVIRQAAVDCKVDFIDIRPAQRDPTDVRGIPAVIKAKCGYCKGSGSLKINDETLQCPVCAGVGTLDMAKWLPPPELPMNPDWRGFISLEELSSAPPLTQAAYYQLVLDRRVGEYYLPKGAYVVASGNRIEDRAVVYKMSTALANRFTHIDFEVNIDNWIEWALKSDIYSDVIAYIKFKPTLLAPAFVSDSSEKAFPTPRTWEFTSRILYKNLSREIKIKLIEGTIGRGATSEFAAFLRLKNDLPDIDEILNGKDYVPAKIDLKYALVSALASKAKTDKHFERLLTYSDKLGGEFSVLLIKLLAVRNKILLSTSTSWKSWAMAHNDLIIDRNRS